VSRVPRPRFSQLSIALASAMVLCAPFALSAPAALASDAIWSGTITITDISPPNTDANTTNSSLTLTLSNPLPDGLDVSVYDDLGQLQSCAVKWGLQSVFSSVVGPANNTTRTYTAYVADSCPNTSAPTGDVRAHSGAVTIRNAGFTGTLAVTADPSSTDANMTNTSLTMTLSKPLADPYSLSVYDDLGQRQSCASAFGGQSEFTAAVGPANDTTRTYTAYVALDCPEAGPPTTGVATQASVAVQNAGFTGTLAVTADPASTDANMTNTSLTMTLSKPLADPYSLSVYDDLGQRQSCASAFGGQSEFTAAVGPANNTTRTYTAYVALDCPEAGPPTTGVAQSQAVTVTNAGYTVSVSVASNAGYVTTTLSKPLVSPYYLSVYDDLGQALSCQGPGGGQSTYDVGVAPPATGNRTYTAYVALDCPDSGTPVNDVRGFAGAGYANGQPAGQKLFGVSVGDLAAQLDRLPADALDEALLLAPGTHSAGSSVTDQKLAFDSTQGPTVGKILAAVAAGAAGNIEVARWLYSIWTGTAPKPSPPPIPAPVPPTPPTPDPTPGPRGPNEEYVDWLTNNFLMRQPTATEEEARQSAKTCVAAVNQALAAGTLSMLPNNVNPCEGRDIYLPGSDNPNVTRHDSDSIFGGSGQAGNLAWIQLSYVSQSDRLSSRSRCNALM